MPHYLKQSTASQILPLGPFLDELDADTPETQLNIANTDILLHKRGATSLVAKNSGGATHMSAGVYYATFNATDSNTLGPMVVYVNMTGALPVKEFIEVLTVADYEARFTATAVSPYVAAPGHTWVYTSANQLIAANTVKGYTGEDDVVLAMDFSGVLGSGNSISTVVSSSFADITGTEPTIVSATKRADGKAVVVILDCTSATANTYTLTVTITTSDSQQLARKGYLELTTV